MPQNTFQGGGCVTPPAFRGECYGNVAQSPLPAGGGVTLQGVDGWGADFLLVFRKVGTLIGHRDASKADCCADRARKMGKSAQQCATGGPQGHFRARGFRRAMTPPACGHLPSVRGGVGTWCSGAKYLSISEIVKHLSVSWRTGADGVRNEVAEYQQNADLPVRELADRSGGKGSTCRATGGQVAKNPSGLRPPPLGEGRS